MNNSLWIEDSKNTNYPKLENNISTDVCIIGGGLTGISLAYTLIGSGLDVTIVDKDKMCYGVSAYSTGKITSQHGLFYDYLINSYNISTASKYLSANENAISGIHDIIIEKNIDCDFKYQDSYVFSTNEDELKKIKAELNALNSLNFNANFCDKISLPIDITGAIKFENQAQFNPRKYAISLLDICNKNNTHIYENTKVTDVKSSHDSYKVLTENNEITCKYVAITSHYPILNFPGFYFLKMYQDKSYIIALDPHDNLFDGMYISSTAPISSYRTAKFNNQNLILMAGSDHKTGDNIFPIQNSFENLENYAKKLYPKCEIVFRWSTEDCVSVDKIPYIGEFSNLMPNVFVATGFKKWGITTSYIASQIISDKILGKQNNYSDIYSATRFHPIKNAKEVGNMLKQTGYSLILNKFSSPTELYENLSPESGGVVDYNGKKLGIYKRNDGKIFAIEPFCTHLGCELTWNNLEKTWDCPCHGSRFDYTGHVITEPAIKDLKQIDL